MSKWTNVGNHLSISPTGRSILIFGAEAYKAGSLYMQLRFGDGTLTVLGQVGNNEVSVYHELEELVDRITTKDEDANLGTILISSVFASQLFLEGKLTPSILVNAQDVGKNVSFKMFIGGYPVTIEVFDALTCDEDVLYSPP